MNNRWVIRIGGNGESRYDRILIWLVCIALGEDYTVKVLFNKFCQIFLRNMISGEVLMYVLFAVLFLCQFSRMVVSLQRKRAFDAIIIVGLTWVYMIVFAISNGGFSNV